MATAQAVRPVSRPKLAARVKKGLRERLSNGALYVMLLPAVVYILLFAYKPMYGVLIAFKDYKMNLGILGSPWVGFANFTRLFKTPWFLITLKNTLTISVLSLVLGFPLPIILALMLNEVPHEGTKRTIQTISYAPHFISTVVMCGMLMLFLSPTSGVINKLIELCGGRTVQFMQYPRYFKWVYVISDIWQGVGWSSIIYFAALSGVDKSLLEAADIDGASRMQKIWNINLPVLVPTIVTLLILQCGSLLSVGYEKVYLLQTDTNLKGSEVISTYVYKVGLEQADFSFSTAVNIFNSVVNSTILILTNTLSNRVGKVGLW